jgi:hypothetical protein
VTGIDHTEAGIGHLLLGDPRSLVQRLSVSRGGASSPQQQCKIVALPCGQDRVLVVSSEEQLSIGDSQPTSRRPTLKKGLRLQQLTKERPKYVESRQFSEECIKAVRWPISPASLRTTVPAIISALLHHCSLPGVGFEPFLVLPSCALVPRYSPRLQVFRRSQSSSPLFGRTFSRGNDTERHSLFFTLFERHSMRTIIRFDDSVLTFA